MVVKTNGKGVQYVEIDGIISSKKCGTCGEMKVLTDFHKSKKYLAGRNSKCKDCVLTYHKLRRAENPEPYRQRDKKYYMGNAQKISESRKEYWKANRSELILKDREYRKKNLDKVKEKDRRYFFTNREKINARRRLSRSKNPIPHRAKLQRRRARKVNLPNDITTTQIQEIIEHFGGCAITGSSDFHIDHVIPLAIGHGGSTLGNLIPLRSDLNVMKKDKNIFEWFNDAEKIYALDRDKFNTVIEYLANINGMTVDIYTEYVYQCFENPKNFIELESEE